MVNTLGRSLRTQLNYSLSLDTHLLGMLKGLSSFLVITNGNSPECQEGQYSEMTVSESKRE